MEMPTPCQHCGEWFDLNDGYCSEKWHPNTTICEACHSEEQLEIEKDEEIQEWIEQIEEAIWEIVASAALLKENKAFDKVPEGRRKIIDLLIENEKKD